MFRLRPCIYIINGSQNPIIRNKKVLDSLSSFHSVTSTKVISPVLSHQLQFRVFFNRYAVKFSSQSGLDESTLVPFKLTDIGEGIKEVELIQWFVKPGERVRQFDKICEVRSDKAAVEITSRFEGRIGAELHEVGSFIETGTTLVNIYVDNKDISSENGEKDQQSSLSERKVEVAEEKTSKSVDDLKRVLATPAVRRVARDHGIDLNKDCNKINASGPHNNILKEDILRYVHERDKAVAEHTPKTLPTFDMETGPICSNREYEKSIAGTEQNIQVLPLRGIQRVMADNMRKALQAPHMGYCDEVNASKLIEMKNALSKKREKGPMTFLPIIIKVTSAALLQYPLMNSRMMPSETAIEVMSFHNIGVAMDTPSGLVVPNIKNVQEKSIFEIADELEYLQELGKIGRLPEACFNGGTFTLSNIGSVGGIFATPVLLVPQVGIGALGQIRVNPRYDNEGNIERRPLLPISWSADHRVIEGATLAKFSNVWIEYLENPYLLLSQMK